MMEHGLTSLNGQQVVVLGGSAGIGLSVAEAALEEGASVRIFARDEDRLRGARKRLGERIEATSLDILDHVALAAYLGEMARIDHVFLAAGAFAPGEIHDGDLEGFRRALDVRLWSSVVAVRAALPRMTDGSSFVFTGGLAASKPHAGAWVTSVATAAAEQMARAIAPTLARFGVRANALSPGWTDTPMWDGILGSDKYAKFAALAEEIPLGRLGRAEEAAAAVLFLFKNRFVTGEVVHVDGGHRWS